MNLENNFTTTDLNTYGLESIASVKLIITDTDGLSLGE